MSRYIGPRLKLVRRLGELPGLTKKVVGKKNNQKLTNGALKGGQYLSRLKEKQKLLYNYGLTEKQLKKLFLKACRVNLPTGQVLLQLLEMRLDSLLWSAGIGVTIRETRQFINHGHILVNGNAVNIANYQCKVNDVISQTENSKSFLTFFPKRTNSIVPSHLQMTNTSFTIIKLPSRYDVALNIQELLVVEYYSR